tara:strand:+ start:2416 stop:2544 length:129 start_codon:yes stop_codon:yes gene_type:complete
MQRAILSKVLAGSGNEIIIDFIVELKLLNGLRLLSNKARFYL